MGSGEEVQPSPGKKRVFFCLELACCSAFLMHTACNSWILSPQMEQNFSPGVYLHSLLDPLAAPMFVTQIDIISK